MQLAGQHLGLLLRFTWRGRFLRLKRPLHKVDQLGAWRSVVEEESHGTPFPVRI
jgi:hypothetical protein